MDLFAPLLTILLLCGINFTLPRWRIFQRESPPAILSVSAGTGLAYVFLEMMPKLAKIQQLTLLPEYGSIFPLQNHAYLAALAGFIIFFLLAKRDLQGDEESSDAAWSRATVVLAAFFALYNAQVGFFLGDWESSGLLSQSLVAAVFGLHIMGLDYHLWHHYPVHYVRHFRGLFCLFMLLGWLGAVLTHELYGLMMITTQFITGAIIVMAIRAELPAKENTHIPLFLSSVAITSCVILVLQARLLDA